MWTETHEHHATKKATLWAVRHTHSLSVTHGQTSQGAVLTKTAEHPHVSVGLAGCWGKDDGVHCEAEAVYWGLGGSACLGVAATAMRLCGDAAINVLSKVSPVHVCACVPVCLGMKWERERAVSLRVVCHVSCVLPLVHTPENIHARLICC
jgi:hypothetical protein